VLVVDNLPGRFCRTDPSSVMCASTITVQGEPV
jgi:hypothetical protein